MLGGVLLALWPLGAHFVGFGEPESSERGAYETYNRLVMPVLVMSLLAGLLGLRIKEKGIYGQLGGTGFVFVVAGLLLTLAGNIAEFWLFTPYTDAPERLRNSAWGAFLLGWVIVYIGAALLGIATMRAKVLPVLGPLLLIISLPVGLAVFFLVKAIGFGNWGGLAVTSLHGAGWGLVGYAVLTRPGEHGRPNRVRKVSTHGHAE